MTTSELVLVDSSMWVESWRPNGDLTARAAVSDAFDRDVAAVCHPVLLEVVGGALTPAEKGRIERHFATVPLLAVTNRVWELASDHAFALRRRGITVPSTDILVMTTAMVHDVPLLHRDRHFLMCREVIPFRDISPLF